MGTSDLIEEQDGEEEEGKRYGAGEELGGSPGLKSRRVPHRQEGVVEGGDELIPLHIFF